MRKAQEIIDESRKYLDVPFFHQGRSIHGLDCVGLVHVVARDLGISDYDIRDYGRRPKGFAFTRHFLSAGCKRVAVSARRAGHLIIIPQLAYPGHIAILTSRDTIIHAHEPDKRVVETALTKSWVERSLGCLRFEGVDYE